MAYDDVGALGGLFAPAYVSGDQQSMDAVARWNAAHLKVPPTADPGQPPINGSFGVSGGGSSNGSKALQPGFDGGGRAIPEGFSLAPSLYTAGSPAITNGPTYSAPAVTGGTQVNGGPDLANRDKIASLLMGGSKSGL